MTNLVDRIYDFANGVVTADVDNESVSTEKLSNAHYASAYDGSDGGEQIQNAIDAADAEAGQNIVVVDGAGPDSPASSPESDVWAMDSPPLLPDGTVLLLVNCYLFLKDGSDDNMLRNEAAYSGDSTRNSHIEVRGIGRAVLDGNAANQNRVDADAFADNNAILFYKVDDVTISNIEIKEPNAWGWQLEDVTDVDCEDIDVDAPETTANQGALDVLGPASNVNLKDIDGVWGDSVIELGTGPGGDCILGSGGEIEDVTISNVSGDVIGDHQFILLLPDGSFDLHDVTIEDIKQNAVGGSEDSPAVLLGGFGGFSNAASQLRDVTIRDIHQTEGKAVEIDTNAENITVTDVTVTDSDMVHVSGSWTVNGLSITDWTINNPSQNNFVFGNDGTVNDFRLTDGVVQSVNTVISMTSGTAANGIVGDLQVSSSTEGLIFPTSNTAGLKLVGGLSPLDVRNFPNIETSQAYHDGSGTNTAGPAYNDGSGWTSLVDGTAIS